MRKLSIFTVLLIIILNFTSTAVDPPKRELRSAWLTTVWGLDWPGTKIPAGGGDIYINTQKQQLIRILDSMKVAGLNAAFFQVRPECDAFYRSSYEPWSAHLVASRGMDPGYDPLQFAIEAAHDRGLELHAWLNPYRFESVAGKYAGQPGDYKQTNPEWVLSYSGGGSILDPGNPEVRKRITDIVREIVINYDIDGVIFDDYFYAYGGTSTALDQYAQNKWKPAGMELGDWRRDNVNRMVADVYHTIQAVKPWVTFGVSPFGIWTVDPVVASSQGLTLPNGITGMDAYKSIYCDPVAWLREGTVDYISPQLYWPTTSTGQDYKVLAPWWSEVVSRFGRHLYVSHSLSDLDESGYPRPQDLKSADSDFFRNKLQGLSMAEYFSWQSSLATPAGLDPSEYGLQIQWNRTSDKNGAPGSVFFRATNLFKKGIINYLRTYEYKYRSLPPIKPWNAFRQHGLPRDLRLDSNRLVWDADETEVRYAVYAIPQTLVNQPGLFSSGKYLLGLAWKKSFDLSAYPSLLNNSYTFAVSVVDRNGNEFPPALMNSQPGNNQPAVLVSPMNRQTVYPGFAFRWKPVISANYYLLEVASDSLFSKVYYKREVTDTTFASAQIAFKEDSTYYWRVFTRMTGVKDTVSPTGVFTLLPVPRPKLVYPLNGATAVEVMPLIQWTFGEGFRYRMQISTNNAFTGVIYDKENIEGHQFRLPPGVVFSYSTYYLRMMAVQPGTSTIWSDVVKFSTLQKPPAIPTIVLPVEGGKLPGPAAEITVRGEPLARSITFQLSNSPSFPWNNRYQYSVDTPDSVLRLDQLTPGAWYVKARANYGSGLYTEWSPAVSFALLSTSGQAIANNVHLRLTAVRISNDVFNISYALPEETAIDLFLTDLAGRRTRVGNREIRMRGEHAQVIQTDGLPRGIYMLTLETKSERKTIKLIK